MKHNEPGALLSWCPEIASFGTWLKSYKAWKVRVRYGSWRIRAIYIRNCKAPDSDEAVPAARVHFGHLASGATCFIDDPERLVMLAKGLSR